MEQPLISIIIPIYNVEKYLRRCLDSVKNQTYITLEILLIDDGSTDDSGKIADNYVDLDSRFKVFHISNGGVSNARNIGLKNYSGKYVTFIDSDDFVDKRFIERLYYAVIKCNVLLARCLPYDSHNERIEEYSCTEFTEPVTIKVREEFDYTEKYGYGPTWGTLFHRSVVGNILFHKDIHVGEDSLFFSEILNKCEYISFIEEKLYVYIFYQQSLSHGLYKEKNKHLILAYQKILILFKSYPNVFKSKLKAKYCNICLANLCQMRKSNYLDKNWQKYVLKEARKNIKELLQSSYSKRRKISALFHCLFPDLYIELYNIRKK